jgi:hypothetical protein
LQERGPDSELPLIRERAWEKARPYDAHDGTGAVAAVPVEILHALRSQTRGISTEIGGMVQGLVTARGTELGGEWKNQLVDFGARH